MANLEKVQLRQRTLERNTALWSVTGWSGLLQDVADQQAAQVMLGKSGVYNQIDISDEVWEIKEFQRDKTNELDRFGIQQDYQIANEKAATERAKLMIKRATDEYVLAVMLYDSRVKDLLMAAKEYAAQVEIEQLEVTEQEAILAVSKEGLRLTQVNAQIFYEYVNRAMVEADIVRAKVDVAKAQVRAIMADIEAQEAQIRVIDEQIKIAMADADKAGLQADVAAIYAEIMTKQLSQVKLDMGRAEIEAGFAYIASKLEDMMAIYDRKQVIEQIKIELQAALYEELFYLQDSLKESEDLKEREQLDNREVFDYTKLKTLLNIQDEANLKISWERMKEYLADAKTRYAILQDNKKLWAAKLINEAHRYVYVNAKSTAVDTSLRTEYIQGEGV